MKINQFNPNYENVTTPVEARVSVIIEAVLAVEQVIGL
jgi:hypothetical protein